MRRRARRGKIGTWILFALVLGALWSVYLFFPPYWVSWNMKKLTKDAVLTYQVSGSSTSAKQKLYGGMKNEHIPLYIEDRDCVFRESKSLFSVECLWVAPIEFTIPGYSVDLSRNFSVYASVNRDGVVDQY